MTAPKNIAIIKLSALGDIIHTLPAFAYLRQTFPNSRISWIVAPVGAKLLENFAGIDNIIPLDLKRKGTLNRLKEVKMLLSKYRNTFDLVLDFQGLLKSAILTWLLKGKVSVGFGKKNLKESQSRFFYRRRVGVFDEGNHVGLKNLYLAYHAGRLFPLSRREWAMDDMVYVPDKTNIDWGRISMQQHCREKWQESVLAFLARHHLEKDQFLIVNVGGGWETKLLERRQYIEVINGIKEKYNVVVLWGNEKEKRTAEEICHRTGVVMADFFNFSQLMLIIEYSRMTVSGDTLALHLADLMGTPTVGIFGPTSPFRNGSLLENSCSVYKKMDCGFCYKKKCGTMECIKKINTKLIRESIEKVYEKKNG